MHISLEELQKVNCVQTDILKQIALACEKLDIRFFVVHGTLLGTLRNKGFIPFDDDIDIAMHRADYERFLTEAPKILGKDYFVQAPVTDPDYPLAFAKVRDSRTAYVVENVRHLDMNHGIYVDVFPIDFIRTGKWAKLKNKLLNLRISSIYQTPVAGTKAKVKRLVCRLPLISVRRAVCLRDWLAKSAPKGDYVCMTGGKPVERKMPAAWFADFVEASFEGLPVWMPGGYDQYLTHIYGAYEKRTLVEGKMADEAHVEINACIVDPEKSYTEYL